MRTLVGTAIATVIATVLGLSLLAGPPAAGGGVPGPATEQDQDRAAASRCWTENRRCFGAVALNTASGKPYWTYKSMTKRAAVRSTMRRCRNGAQPSGCTKAGWVSNGCIAVYYREVGGVARDWASGVRYSEVGARKRARNRLIGPGRRKAWSWPCTARSPQYRTRGLEKFGQW